ncbi:GGDEF domain-containing protein [Roseateles albus]|nr:GGDEF domain-containing protein [Roseateles albus]
MHRLNDKTRARRDDALTPGEQLPLSVALDMGMSSAEIDMNVAMSGGHRQTSDIAGAKQGGDSPNLKLAETVAKLQERNRELQMQVQLDALTGLRSRRALDQVLQMTCGGQAAGAEQCAVVFLDIDHFGIYNKRHGDDEGDHALRKVAKIIRATARQGDHVFRKGGEELVTVLPGANGPEARQVAERMRAAVEAAAIRHDGSPTAPVITITVGVADSHLGETATLDQLMNRAAKKAMQAKIESQRNQVHVA